jgi:flagellar biosynthesis chaperone FliJ
MDAPTKQTPAEEALANLFCELQDFIQRLDLRIDGLEMQLKRIEANSDSAARELAEISREHWIQRTTANSGQ